MYPSGRLELRSMGGQPGNWELAVNGAEPPDLRYF